MRSIAHWTPNYIGARLRDIWYQRTHPRDPWFTPDAIAFVSCWLKPTDIGFEWGSGRSTLWLANKVQHLTSVEHNPAWHGRVRPNLPSNVTYELREAGSSYVAAIDNHGDFDFVVVDGIERDQCAARAIRHLKPGGILIIDNVNWYIGKDPRSRSPNSRSAADGHDGAKWTDVAERLSSWRYFWTSNGVWDTAVYLKPYQP